ncbi:MAG: hypothetical protein ABIS47_09785 [Acidimicrobiales bacterium]
MTMKKVLAAGVVGALVLGGAGVAGAAGTTSTSAPNPSACDERGSWPTVAQGEPRQLDAGDRGALTMWHDPQGWHVRVTHRPNGERTFTGRITTSTGRIAVVREVRDEAADIVRLSDGGATLAFSFSNHGGIDGVDFRVACSRRLEVVAGADGRRLPTERVKLGRFGVHPTSNPFVLRRS